MEKLKGDYVITPGSSSSDLETGGDLTALPLRGDGVILQSSASSFLRCAAFALTLLNALLLLLGSNLPWLIWDFTGVAGLQQPAEMSNARGFGYLSLSYFWECLSQQNALIPPSCEVTNNAELADSISSLVQVPKSVLGGVIKTGAVRAFVVIAIIAIIAALFASISVIGWGEYASTAAGAVVESSSGARVGSTGGVTANGSGNVSTLKWAALWHACAAFALLIALSAYQASVAGVDQWRFVATFYNGLTQAQIVGAPDSVFALGSGRSMAVAALVFELGLAGGLGYLAYAYKRQGYAPPQVSLWSRVLPASIAHKLGVV